MNETNVRRYDSINVNSNTKLRIDKLYYENKVDKNFKTFDDFINHLADVFEKNKYPIENNK